MGPGGSSPTLLTVALVAFTAAICVAVAEASLRLWYPKYQYAAEAQFSRDGDRIWSREPDTHYWRKHPDTGVPHLVIHNALALRHHRNFPKSSLRDSTNIGVFGDSYAENLRLPVQYSFTEVLDYLLNLEDGRFNVLNFGVDGYGTGQSFLHYRHAESLVDLDYVFYLYCGNDIRNIYENGLFVIDEDGQVVRNQLIPTPWWKKVFGRLHLTYLILDASYRFSSVEDAHGVRSLEEKLETESRDYGNLLREQFQARFHDETADAIESGKDSDARRESSQIFYHLLRTWRDRVHENGGEFFVVLLPTPGSRSLPPRLIEEGIRVIDLYALAVEALDVYDRQEWRFRNDGHWNEAGNQLAAVLLHDMLQREVPSAGTTATNLKQALYAYYNAFPNGWRPRRWVERAPSPSSRSAEIRAKYTAFERKPSSR